MKKLFAVLAGLSLFLAGNNASAQEQTEWAEMEAFHTVMSQTWHPVEEGNYAPIRERAGELAAAATAWKKSAIPANYTAQKDIKKNLKELAEEAAELEKEIKNGSSDGAIKEKLGELHDLFHDIVGLCKE